MSTEAVDKSGRALDDPPSSHGSSEDMFRKMPLHDFFSLLLANELREREVVRGGDVSVGG